MNERQTHGATYTTALRRVQQGPCVLRANTYCDFSEIASTQGYLNSAPYAKNKSGSEPSSSVVAFAIFRLVSPSILRLFVELFEGFGSGSSRDGANLNFRGALQSYAAR